MYNSNSHYLKSVNDLLDRYYVHCSSTSTSDLKVKYFTEQLEDRSIITFLVPGYSKENLSINIEGNILKVKGKVDTNQPGIVPSFEKSFEVDGLLNAKVIADCEAGVLEIEITPNKPEVIKKAVVIN